MAAVRLRMRPAATPTHRRTVHRPPGLPCPICSDRGPQAEPLLGAVLLEPRTRWAPHSTGRLSSNAQMNCGLRIRACRGLGLIHARDAGGKSGADLLDRPVDTLERVTPPGTFPAGGRLAFGWLLPGDAGRVDREGERGVEPGDAARSGPCGPRAGPGLRPRSTARCDQEQRSFPSPPHSRGTASVTRRGRRCLLASRAAVVSVVSGGDLSALVLMRAWCVVGLRCCGGRRRATRSGLVRVRRRRRGCHRRLEYGARLPGRRPRR